MESMQIKFYSQQETAASNSEVRQFTIRKAGSWSDYKALEYAVGT